MERKAICPGYCSSIILFILSLTCVYSSDAAVTSSGELNVADVDDDDAGHLLSNSCAKFVLMIDVDMSHAIIPGESITAIRVAMSQGFSAVSGEPEGDKQAVSDASTLKGITAENWTLFKLEPDDFITHDSKVKVPFYMFSPLVENNTEATFDVSLISSDNKEFIVNPGNSDGNAKNNNSLKLTVVPTKLLPHTHQFKVMKSENRCI